MLQNFSKAGKSDLQNRIFPDNFPLLPAGKRWFFRAIVASEQPARENVVQNTHTAFLPFLRPGTAYHAHFPGGPLVIIAPDGWDFL